MARTYTQAAVNSALNYLMTGGPAGGPLTRDQYEYEIRHRLTWYDQQGNFLGLTDGHSGGDFTKWPKISQSALDFCSCLWLAVQQGVITQPGLATAKYIARTKDANGNTVFYTDSCHETFFCEVRRRMFDSRLKLSGRSAKEGVVMLQRIKDWTRSDWTKIATSRWDLWKFKRFLKTDIKKFKKDAEMQATVYQTEVAARDRAFNDFRTVIAETQVAEEGWDYVDLGDGAGVQVFEGNTQKRAIAAIVKAQRNTNAISHNFKK